MCTYKLRILFSLFHESFHGVFIDMNGYFCKLTLLLLYRTVRTPTLSCCWTLNEPNWAGGFFYKNNSVDFLYFL